MSEAVIEFLSEAGHVQALGKDAFGLGLVTHGAITLVSDNMTHPQPMVVGQVTVSGVNPVLAFKAHQQVNVYAAALSGGNFTFYFRAQSSVALGLQYWVFDTAARALRDPTLADVEAAIYDEFGVKTFDLTMHFMRVANVIETPTPPNQIPFGHGGGTFGDSVDVQVPAGRTYAVVQATPFFISTTYDTGSYGNGQYPPELSIGDGEPPLGMTWRHQILEGYYSSGGYVGASTIRAGITRFEYWQQWNPASAQPHLNMDGECRHLVIDVTGLPSTPLPNPNTPNVAISAATRSVSVQSATNATTDTPAVSITITGGTAPYSIAWVRQSGSTAVAPAGSTTSTSFSTRSTNQAPGTTLSAIYVANVTDAVGATRTSDPVTFTHTVGAVDKTPDPVTLNGMSPSTTNNVLGDTASNAIQIAGINAQITLRWERYNPTGSIDAITVVVQKAASSSGPWTDAGSFDPLLTGYRYADVTANNGDWFRYVIRGATTNAGRKVYSFNLSVWNLDLNNQIATNRPVSVTVDSDDNHYAPDPHPNPITVGDLSLVTNDPSGWTNTSEFRVLGINQSITLRFTRGNQVDRGGIFTRRLFIYHSTNGSTWTEYFIGAGAQGIADIAVNNGDYIHIRAYCDVSAGRGETTFNGYVTNLTTGVQLASFAVSAVVDADNNDNVADPNPDAMSWPNISWSTNEHYLFGAYNANGPTISGINQTITLRFQFTTASSNTSWQNLEITNHQHQTYAVIENFQTGSWVDVDVVNGSTFIAKCSGGSDSGRRTAGGTVSVTNRTTGASLGSFTVGITVDADNNYNAPPTVKVSPTYFDQWEYANQGQFYTVYVGRTYINISGGQGPFQHSWERSGGLSGWSVSNTDDYADFYYTARTNFSGSASYRLKITDAQNRVAYSDWVSVSAAAGDTLN